MVTIETGTNDERGTWVHPEVAISIASWVSPEFEVWANRTLRLVLNGEFKPLTEEAIEAKKQLDQLWEEIRKAGKVTRRTLTDAIKSYLASNEVSANYKQWVYSNCSDKINLALFGKKAAKLCTERGCERDELRNTHDQSSLALIDRIEGHAVRLIDKGMEPQLATQDAIDFYS